MVRTGFSTVAAAPDVTHDVRVATADSLIAIGDCCLWRSGPHRLGCHHLRSRQCEYPLGSQFVGVGKHADFGAAWVCRSGHGAMLGGGFKHRTSGTLMLEKSRLPLMLRHACERARGRTGFHLAGF